MKNQWTRCAIWLIATLLVLGALFSTAILNIRGEFDFPLGWLYVSIVEVCLCFCLFVTVGNATHHAAKARDARDSL